MADPKQKREHSVSGSWHIDLNGGHVEWASADHIRHILKGVCHLWQKQQLFDCVIVAEGTEFQAHKVFLAAVSEYFRAMWTGTMLESRMNKVTLKGLSATGLKPLLQFIYTGHLELTEHSVVDVLSCATHLQISSAIALCVDYLIHTIETNNCIDILNLAELYCLDRLKCEADNFILEHFQEIAKNKQHTKLNFRQLVEYVSSDALRCGSEFALFKQIQEWVESDLQERGHHFHKLVGSVRFPLMSLEQLSQVEQVDFMERDSCRALLFEAQEYHGQSDSQVEKCSFQFQIRNEASVVAFGGDIDDQTCSKTFYMLIKEEWKRLPDTDYEFSHASLAVLNNTLYVCGGFKNGYEITNQCFVFEPRFMRWKPLPSMEVPRTYFPLVVCGEALYALGGCEDKQTPYPTYLNTATVEQFSLRDGQWRKVEPIDTKLRKHGGCAVDGKIYISGGLQENLLASNRLLCYCPQFDSWEEKAQMSSVRFSHSMITVGKLVYIIDCLESQMEYYRPDTNQWTSLEISVGSLPAFSRVLAFHADFYLINGRLDDQEEEKEQVCLKVNVVTRERSFLPMYPQDVGAPHCCVLTLPQEVVDEAKIRQDRK